MSNEIEEFLRRAAVRRQQQAQQRQPRPPQAMPPMRPTQLPPPEIQILEPEIIEAQPARTEGVAAHVAHHLDTREYSERASHLGEQVGLADDNLDEHLRQVFDHNVSRLGGALEDTSKAARQPAKPSAEQDSGGFDIAALLANPQNIRNAIILSEILNRPDDRW